MKLFLLSLLVLTTLCFVLGDEDNIQPNFDDLIENDRQMVEDTPDDYTEDEEDSYMEDDEDFIPEEQDDGELRDPDGFKDDDDANQTGGNKIPPGGGKRPVPPVVDPIVEPTRPSKGEEFGSGTEPNKADGPDFKDDLKNRLGLDADSDDPEFTKK